MDTSVDRRTNASEHSLPKPAGIASAVRSETDHHSMAEERKLSAAGTPHPESTMASLAAGSSRRTVPATESPIVVTDDVTRPPQSSVSDYSVDLPAIPDPKTSPPSTVASVLPMPLKTPELRLNRTESGKRKTSSPGLDDTTAEPPKNTPAAASILQSPERKHSAAASIVEEVVLRQPQENRPVTQI